jgi:hypothetical protein
LVFDVSWLKGVASTRRAADLELELVKKGFRKVKLAAFNEKARRGYVGHEASKESKVRGKMSNKTRSIDLYRYLSSCFNLRKALALELRFKIRYRF